MIDLLRAARTSLVLASVFLFLGRRKENTYVRVGPGHCTLYCNWFVCVSVSSFSSEHNQVILRAVVVVGIDGDTDVTSTSVVVDDGWARTKDETRGGRVICSRSTNFVRCVARETRRTGEATTVKKRHGDTSTSSNQTDVDHVIKKTIEASHVSSHVMTLIINNPNLSIIVVLKKNDSWSSFSLSRVDRYLTEASTTRYRHHPTWRKKDKTNQSQLYYHLFFSLSVVPNLRSPRFYNFLEFCFSIVLSDRSIDITDWIPPRTHLFVFLRELF